MHRLCDLRHLLGWAADRADLHGEAAAWRGVRHFRNRRCGPARAAGSARLTFNSAGRAHDLIAAVPDTSIDAAWLPGRPKSDESPGRLRPGRRFLASGLQLI